MHNMLYYNIDYAFLKISNIGDALFLSIKYEKFNILDLKHLFDVILEVLLLVVSLIVVMYK